VPTNRGCQDRLPDGFFLSSSSSLLSVLKEDEERMRKMSAMPIRGMDAAFRPETQAQRALCATATEWLWGLTF
jgi:hypothetical protein